MVPLSPDAPTASALARSVCPIYTLMRAFQNTIRNWVTQYGTVYLFHGPSLINALPPAEVEVIRYMLASNQDELKRQLAASRFDYVEEKQAVAALLGHITEFLVSQRGLTR